MARERQEAKSEASISAVLDAALELFSTQGYRATPLRQIAEQRSRGWITAAWVNARNQRGPVGTSVSTHIQFGESALPILNVVRKVA